MNYPKIVKKLRIKLLLSQSEIASLLDVFFASINRWEKDKSEPTIKVKRNNVELCNINNISLEE